jgi:hypothetical protein
MGANAVTTFPTYTTGQVLEAADLNITNCGVPTFADSTARDGAFGGTGEKTLAEGQLCYLEDSNIVQYYDGSVWATVGPTTAGGLVRISTTTATSGGTLAITNAFSSTYNSYLIVIDDLLTAGGGAVLSMTLGATSTGYYYAGMTISYSAGTTVNINGSNTTSWTLGQVDNTLKGGAIVQLTNPNIASATSYTSMGTDPRTAESTKFIQGFVNNSTQYTDFTIACGIRTFASVSVKVYGYAQ